MSIHGSYAKRKHGIARDEQARFAVHNVWMKKKALCSRRVGGTHAPARMQNPVLLPFLLSPPWCRPPWLFMIKRYASISNAYLYAMLAPSLALAWKRPNVRSSRNAVIFPLLGTAWVWVRHMYQALLVVLLSPSSISPPNEKPPPRWYIDYSNIVENTSWDRRVGFCSKFAT